LLIGYWRVFFLVLAGINEVMRAQFSFETWLWAKLWVFMPLSFIFTFTQLPMLLKHGLDVGQDEEAEEAS
jgi:intracellular septation protein